MRPAPGRVFPPSCADPARPRRRVLGLAVVVAELPAGVLADTISRRLALVVAHVVKGGGMTLTGLVTGYPVIILRECPSGLGWAISTGVAVALDHR